MAQNLNGGLKQRAQKALKNKSKQEWLELPDDARVHLTQPDTREGWVQFVMGQG